MTGTGMCPVCGRPVPPRKRPGGNHKIYCSKRCQGTAYQRRQRALTARPRRGLPDAAHDAGWKLRKAVERIERITADDRFSANREKVAAELNGHLQYAADTCARIISQLHPEG
jgi:hypothetical protein